MTRFVLTCLFALLCGGAAAQAQAAQKVLHVALPAAETGFDPAQVSDLYSAIVNAHIFEAVVAYDPLARPFKIIPATAVAMPEPADDFRTWTVRIRPGIRFADDPAFKGQPRELTAADYVYSFKRFFDPALKSPAYSGLVEEKILGLDAVRQAALKERKPFDYDTEVPGLRALDRYTLRIQVENPRPRFLYTLASVGAVAREVAEAYAGRTMEHPVGTGPFRLAEWRRSSRIVLERNPGFREVHYDGAPAADDTEGRAILARLKGRRLPMVDRVEIAVVEESQPRWLAFLNGEFDTISVPLEFANTAAPNGELAPNLKRRGMQLYRALGADRTFFYFNMEDPLVGGLAPEKVALRRAISLGTDVQREIAQARRGQAIAAQGPLAPGTYGYDPHYRSENSAYDLPRAKALLDLFGYVDRNGDGWREQPDGQPLVLRYATQPDAISRQFDELWKKNMDALGLRLEIRAAQWPEQLKQARAGRLMIWQLGSSSGSPDGADTFSLGYGPAAGGGNLSRFKLPAYDELVRKLDDLPDGPERLAAMRDASRLLTAYMPMKFNVHRIGTELAQPWIVGYRRPAFGNQWWQYVDVDLEKGARAAAR